jgi:hypothetical protein
VRPTEEYLHLVEVDLPTVGTVTVEMQVVLVLQEMHQMLLAVRELPEQMELLGDQEIQELQDLLEI